MKNDITPQNDSMPLVGLLIARSGADLTISDLAREFGVPPTTILRRLLRLETDGLIFLERYGAPNPPVITVTEEGRRRLEEWQRLQAYTEGRLKAAPLSELLTHVSYQPARMELERRFTMWRMQ